MKISLADLPDPDDDGFYLRYVESCRRIGVEPCPRERVRQLVNEWNARIAEGIGPPPPMH